jgi:hypothetical protein
MNLLTKSIVASQRVRRTSPTPAPSNPQEPKVKEAETFHGLKNTLNAFLTECELVFELQPTRFREDRIKISYMVSLLRDTPLLAIKHLLSQKPPTRGNQRLREIRPASQDQLWRPR